MKKQKNLSPSSLEKIEKMYQAVMELLENGADINTMKVADIASKARIGKGTAYEYFDSKEEIIANALKYYMKQQHDSLLGKNELTSSFQEKIFQSLDWIKENLQSKSCGIQFFKATQESWDLSGKVSKEFGEKVKESCGINCILEEQIKAAVQEKKWLKDASPFLMKLSLESGYIEYFLYLSNNGEKQGIDNEKMKRFVFEGIVRKLDFLQEEKGMSKVQ